MNVIKANGDEVSFDEEKIRRSLRRVKADPDVVEIVLERVIGKMYDRITTSDLYSIVFRGTKNSAKAFGRQIQLEEGDHADGADGLPFRKVDLRAV